MSSVWHWFIVIGTLGSLTVFLVLLFSNRKAATGATTGHEYDGIAEYDNPMPQWWMWLFVGTIAFGLGYLIWYPGLGNSSGLSGWSSADQLRRDEQAHEARFAPLYAELARLDEAELHTNRQALQVGRRLFINHCSTCHGVNGRGAFGFPNLTDEEWIWGRGFEQVKTAAGDHAQRPAGLPGVDDGRVRRGLLPVRGQVEPDRLGRVGRRHEDGDPGLSEPARDLERCSLVVGQLGRVRSGHHGVLRGAGRELRDSGSGSPPSFTAA